MEGARWDKRRKSLADQEFGAMFDPMPMIGFVPYEIKELSLKEQKKLPKPVQTYQ
jgi:hypothetical protein